MLFGGVFLISFVLLFFNAYKTEEINSKIYHKGEIIAGSDEPEDRELYDQLEKENGFLLMLGGNKIISPKISILKTKKGDDYIKLRIENNKLLLTTKVIDAMGNNGFTITDNKFKYSKLFTFYPFFPDPHSMIVRDAADNEVLKIRFANNRTVKLTGKFFIPGYSDPLLIGEKETTFKNISFASSTLNLKKAGSVFDIL